ncbi:cell separation during budding [Pleurotus ostreatus]|nr:cell separation during budding [Pleurotus ostreatus]
MSNSRRMSESFWIEPAAPTGPPVPSVDRGEWIGDWQQVYARDIIDSPLISVDSDTSVEDACELLLSEDIMCLAVRAQSQDANSPSYAGLFDFSDVNAFLTLAATRHTFLPEFLAQNPKIDGIVAAARAGRVPVKLVSDLSEKNPLKTVRNDASIIALLEVFAGGAHRVLVKSESPDEPFIGMVSDRSLLSWFHSYAQRTPSFCEYLSHPLSSLGLPSLNIHSSVVAASSVASVLDAMKLMSEEGVSSVAVVDEESGALLSAVSVTDIGKIVVPSESNQILSTPLQQFIAQIKEPDGSLDGADKYPVYSISPSTPLSYTMEKLLATNSHRLFVTRESGPGTSPVISPSYSTNLTGIVSVVDVLSLFARLADIPNVDPTRMQRHRRASSASSHSSMSDLDIIRSRSSSRTSTRRSPRIMPVSPPSVISDLH